MRDIYHQIEERKWTFHCTQHRTWLRFEVDQKRSELSLKFDHSIFEVFSRRFLSSAKACNCLQLAALGIIDWSSEIIVEVEASLMSLSEKEKS